MEKILITGGSGFIGTNLIDLLIEKKEFEILNVDIQAPKKEEHLEYYCNADICNYSEFEKAVNDFNPDYIVHLAARCDLRGENVDDYSANTEGVRNLMSIVKNLAKLKKVLVTSSMLVCHPGYRPKDQFDYCATTVYGESKIITEKITWESGVSCDWSILRPTSIWGPWFEEPYKQFFKMIIDGKYTHIGGNTALMTYGYVENTVAQILEILFSDTTNGKKVFYLGDYDPTPIEIWADEIANEAGKKIMTIPRFIIDIAAKVGDFLAIIGIAFPLTSFRLSNMTKDNVFDMEETKAIAKVLPFSREEGVKKTYEWMIKKGII